MIEKTMKMHPRGDQIMEKYIKKVENKILNQVSSAWKVFINDVYCTYAPLQTAIVGSGFSER